MSAWRIEIRTGFYHRAKKTRPIKGLKSNPAEGRCWVLLAQCETLGETQSKNGHNPKVIPVVFISVVAWRDATIAILSENARCAFYGRGVPRP